MSSNDSRKHLPSTILLRYYFVLDLITMSQFISQYTAIGSRASSYWFPVCTCERDHTEDFRLAHCCKYNETNIMGALIGPIVKIRLQFSYLEKRTFFKLHFNTSCTFARKVNNPPPFANFLPNTIISKLCPCFLSSNCKYVSTWVNFQMVFHAYTLQNCTTFQDQLTDS